MIPLTPVKLVMENFVSHTKSTVDFTQFKAALIVGSFQSNPDISNGAGKSAIFDAICWALYGKSKYSTKDKVVKWGKSECNVEFTFTISDDLYRVTRSIDLRSGISDVTFFKKESDEWVKNPYTADTPTATTRNIVDKIGVSYNAFVNVVYFRQKDISGFAEATVAEKKDILKNILQINIWDDLQKITKEKVKPLTAQRMALEKRIQSLGDLDKEKEENKINISDIDTEISVITNVIHEAESKLRECEEEISYLEMSLLKLGSGNQKRLEERLNQISSRREDIKKRKDILTQQIKSNNEIIVKSNDDSIALESRLLNLSKDVLIVSHKNREEAERLFLKLSSQKVPEIQYSSDTLEKRKFEKDKHRRLIDVLRLQIKQLELVEPGAECPTCLEEIKDIDQTHLKRNQRKAYLEEKIEKQVIIVKELDFLIDTEQEIIDKANDSSLEIQRVGLMRAKQVSSLKEAERHNEDIQRELSRLAEEWKSLKESKKKIDALIKNFGNLNKTQSNLASAFEKKKSLSKQIEEKRTSVMKLSIKKGNLEAKAEEIERKISEKDTLVSEKNNLSFDIEAYESLVKAFSKDGIPAIIMENITEDLKTYSNDLLSKMSHESMSIDFVTQRQTGSGNWKEDFDIKVSKGSAILDFSDLSGGEGVRVAFAIRLALSRLLMRRVGSNIRFLLLDEVDQALDKYGINVLAECIHMLSDEFKILLITHDDLMKEKFEHIIMVQKGSAGSTIRQ